MMLVDDQFQVVLSAVELNFNGSCGRGCQPCSAPRGLAGQQSEPVLGEREVQDRW